MATLTQRTRAVHFINMKAKKIKCKQTNKKNNKKAWLNSNSIL